MISPRNTLLFRLWFLVVVILVAGNLILLAMHLSGTDAISISSTSRFSGDPQAIINDLALSMNKAGHAISNDEQSAMTAVGKRLKLAGSNLQNSMAGVGRGMIDVMASIGHTANHMTGVVTNASVVSDLIRPQDKSPIPVITPVPGISKVAAIQTVSQVIPQTGAAVQWPIHGAITTLFGVSDWPYELVHTGLDISDGRPPGTTPIRPFKPGRVADIIRSGGLGNHVVIDHGGGMTSVYGHLYSIAVQAGQPVDENTVLGYEGSTGASTGTHLHFEIRINGQPENPQRFISGHP